VVDSARVRADVKSAHIRALKMRFRAKKVARTRRSTIVLFGERWKNVEREAERVDVREVVVLGLA